MQLLWGFRQGVGSRLELQIKALSLLILGPKTMCLCLEGITEASLSITYRHNRLGQCDSASKRSYLAWQGSERAQFTSTKIVLLKHASLPKHNIMFISKLDRLCTFRSHARALFGTNYSSRDRHPDDVGLRGSASHVGSQPRDASTVRQYLRTQASDSIC